MTELQNLVIELRSSFLTHALLYYLISNPDPVYDDLYHPPATYLGPKYQYRQPDGSCNNPADPDAGKAGTPYGRSVQQMQSLPANMLPDPGLVFDTLLRREKVRFEVALTCTSVLTCAPYVSVCQTPCRIFQHVFFMGRTCRPFVSYQLW
jgi:hypothetical protein